MGCDEMALERREVPEGLIGADCLFAGDEGDTDLARGDGCDVSLAMVAPVDLDEAAPGSDCVVLAKSDTAGVGGSWIEPSEGGDAGVVAVSADEIAGVERLIVGVNCDVPAGRDTSESVLPMEANAQAGGVVE